MYMGEAGVGKAILEFINIIQVWVFNKSADHNTTHKKEGTDIFGKDNQADLMKEVYGGNENWCFSFLAGMTMHHWVWKHHWVWYTEHSTVVINK